MTVYTNTGESYVTEEISVTLAGALVFEVDEKTMVLLLTELDCIRD